VEECPTIANVVNCTVSLGRFAKKNLTIFVLQKFIKVFRSPAIETSIYLILSNWMIYGWQKVKVFFCGVVQANRFVNNFGFISSVQICNVQRELIILGRCAEKLCYHEINNWFWKVCEQTSFFSWKTCEQTSFTSIWC